MSLITQKGYNPFLCIAKDFTKMKGILAAFGDDQEGRTSFIAERTIHLRAVKDVRVTKLLLASAADIPNLL